MAFVLYFAGFFLFAAAVAIHLRNVRDVQDALRSQVDPLTIQWESSDYIWSSVYRHFITSETRRRACVAMLLGWLASICIGIGLALQAKTYDAIAVFAVGLILPLRVVYLCRAYWSLLRPTKA